MSVTMPVMDIADVGVLVRNRLVQVLMGMPARALRHVGRQLIP